MVLNIGDQFVIWRTGGGLYVSSDGQVGKPCALRQNPYGAAVTVPRPGRQFELVFTEYGWRQRPLAPEDVRPGMSLFIEMGAEWTQTSTIHDVFQGVRVDAIEPGSDYLVYSTDRAALVTDGDTSQSRALLKCGWVGSPEPLGDWAQHLGVVIVRIDRSYQLPATDCAEHHSAPGWAGIMQYLDGQLRDIDERITMVSSGYASDGLLSLRLTGVPVTEHGRPIEPLRTAVEAAEQAACYVCTVCGAPGTVVLVQEGGSIGGRAALCEEHAAERAAEAASESSHDSLLAGVDRSRLRVEPGWYPIVAELHRGVSALSPYEFRTCRQHLGSLLVLIDLPEGTSTEVVEQVNERRSRAQTLAEQTCEHCGEPGARVTEPWVHVCCGDCPVSVPEGRRSADSVGDVTRGMTRV